MAGFMIRFLICNLFISGIIGILLIVKKVFGSHLTSRMQYNLWFLLLGLLAAPFIPLHPVGFPQIFSWLDIFKASSASNSENMTGAASIDPSGVSGRINDFAVSVSREAPSTIGLILGGIWMIGILAMILLVIRSKLRLNAIKKSALPLQSKKVRKLYGKCLDELGISTDIPVYSTAFFKSPVIAGLFKPSIYLPIHMISDYCATDMRYILLHELQHYKHKDAYGNYLMNLAGILYWFNPFVWYALKEMRNDREIACDTSVLNLLSEADYEDYGNTLLDFAEKVSLMPFPFAAGISGAMKQMQKRIIHISSYKKPSVWKKIKGTAVFSLITVMFWGLTPMLSTYAAEQNYYRWNISPEKIDLIDLSSYFNGYKGSFVLYDLKGDSWSIYDIDHATLRTAPNSTYKIYDALFGLEEGIITPNDSFMTWNGADYPFESWNADQNLYSAMRASVNWYFQEIDGQLGASALRSYIKEIGYGNENINSDLSSFWMESTLKISPVEQVELLTALYNNDFGFIPENVNAVKDSICLFSTETESFYGKTGTGRINENDITRWFVGYIKTADSTYCFAANIQSTENATGSKASEISLSILSDMGIWKQ